MQVIHGNCYDYFDSVADKSIDMIVLDPNYEDWKLNIQNGIVEIAMSKLKDTGNLLLFTKKPYDFEVRKHIDYCYRNEIIWKYIKTGNWVSNAMPTYSYQKIFWCCGNKPYFNPRTGIKYSPYTRHGQ